MGEVYEVQPSQDTPQDQPAQLEIAPTGLPFIDPIGVPDASAQEDEEWEDPRPEDDPDRIRDEWEQHLEDERDLRGNGGYGR